MDNTDGRMDVVVLGRKLGTADGWDTIDTASFVFYDFISEVESLVTADTLNVDFENGVIETRTGDRELFTADIVTAIGALPRIKAII